MTITIKEIHNLRTEGSDGIESLAFLANGLGYNSNYGYRVGNNNYISQIQEMLEDNPGMVEAIIGFVVDNKDFFDNIMEHDDNEVESLRAKVEEITDGNFEVYESYSGRGMFGEDSEFAFTTPYCPNSDIGQELKALGFAVDNLGRNFIYYLD